jgi:flagellar hook-associated protein 3 FlgL
MTMRVPNLLNNAQSMLDLQRIKQQYSQTVLQLTTGKAIINVGDDPTASAQISNYQSAVDLNSQYISQADTATGQLQNSSTILTSITNDINRLMELGQAGTSGDASANATEVDTIRTDLISLGNTQIQGKYLFSGTVVSTTPPFVDSGPVAAPATQTVTYNGDNATTKVNISSSATVATNIPGDTLFFGGSVAANPAIQGQSSPTDLFGQTAALRDALASNNQAGVQTALTNLKAISARIGVMTTDLGGRENGVTTMQNGLSDFNANLQSQLSTIQSVDYPTAITQLSQESLAQQASLNAMARANQKSLFDYIA